LTLLEYERRRLGTDKATESAQSSFQHRRSHLSFGRRSCSSRQGESEVAASVACGSDRLLSTLRHRRSQLSFGRRSCSESVAGGPDLLLSPFQHRQVRFGGRSCCILHGETRLAKKRLAITRIAKQTTSNTRLATCRLAENTTRKKSDSQTNRLANETTREQNESPTKRLVTNHETL
jgi:hypothetical protein